MENNELDDLFRSNADYLGDEPPRSFDKDAFWQHLQAELPRQSASRKKPAAWWWAAASVLLAGMLGGIWWMQSAEKKSEHIAMQPWSASPQTSQPWPVSPQADRDDEGLRRDASLRHRTRGEEDTKAPKEIFAKKEKQHAALPARSAPPELEPVTAMRTPAVPLPIVEKPIPQPWSVSPQTSTNSEGLWGGTPMRYRPRTQAQPRGHASKNEARKENLARKEKRRDTPPARSKPSEPTLELTIKTPTVFPTAIEKPISLPEVVAPVTPKEPVYRVVHINEVRERKQQEAKARARVAFRLGLPDPPPSPETTEDKLKLSITIPH